MLCGVTTSSARGGWLRCALLALTLGGAWMTPAVCHAEVPRGGEDEPSFFSYSFRGLFLGAGLGLAVGYLSTGDKYESGEWKNLVIGAGVGGLLGIGSGITLALVDESAMRVPTGRYILRDMWYGALLGAAAGAGVGALVFIGSDRLKDVLIGTAIGALPGAALGFVFGVIEAANARPRHRPDEARVGFTLAAVPTGSRVPALVPSLYGRF